MHVLPMTHFKWLRLNHLKLFTNLLQANIFEKNYNFGYE